MTVSNDPVVVEAGELRGVAPALIAEPSETAKPSDAKRGDDAIFYVFSH
jgi:hypothetical protein